ncbi:hybrid sensor histidine kinase/response regulator transcription factor [Alteromonas sp. ASW11-130]|uniref:hybrid sensor histidine kinase/response regulator transcription factor n=1 Tax=Alteromonas sp. ASW11-130 TaxID=3015775 RepID=UPI0022423849|nr:hybrid sensor histidine kinase/response regulator transcription factor [Alteromonas sp. ASW11-130]MCW8093161.1 ATP-binding protein [Alteromonas sp. ASW11-130]
MRLKTVIFGTILFLSFFDSIAVSSTPLQFTNQFDGKATGVLTSLVVAENGSIWLGGENGLFGVMGKKFLHFYDKKTSLNKNYISSLEKLQENKLLVAVYGEGLFIFDTIEYSFTKIVHPSDVDLNAVWKLALAEDHLVVSTISNIYLLNIHTFDIEADFRDIGINVGSKVFNVDFQSESQKVWWTDEKRGVFSYSLVSENWTSYSSTEYFESSNSISALYVEKEKVFIGTEIGLFELDAEKDSSILISMRPGVVHDKHKPIRSIQRSPAGNLWVAAERLYKVNFEQQTFESAPQLYPFLTRGELDTVLQIDFDTQENLLAIDTSKGLVIVPPQLKAVSYLNENLRIFREHINSAKFIDKETLLFLSEKKVGVYDLTSNQMNFYPMPSVEKMFIGKTSKSEIEIVSQAGSRYSIRLGEGNIFTFNNVLTNKSSTILELEVDSAGELVFIEEGEERDYLISEHNDSFKKLLSNAFSTLHVSATDDILAAASGEGIYKIQEKDKVQRIGRDSNFELSNVVCIFEDPDGEIWACTSGEGAYKLKKGENKFTRVSAIPANYIRAIAAIDQRWVLVTTNIGLFLYNKKEDKSFHLGNEFGIPDTDFAYKGIYTSPAHTLIAGDNLNYIIDNQKLISSIEQSAKKVHQAVISSFNSFDEKKNILVPTGVRFYNALKSGDELELANEEFMFEVGLTVANFLERERLQIEYRLLGLNDEWTRSSDSTANIVYSSLSFGSYTFETRVVDTRSSAVQPISRLHIRVLPPFWLSLEAFILYSLLLCLLMFHLYRRYRQKLSLHGTELSGVVDEKQTALSDSSLSIRKLLERKQMLFTNISHELRTPLALVLGPLKQVQRKPTDCGNTHRIHLALDNAHKLEKLVDQLLEIEQVETLCENERKTYDIKHDLSAIIANVQPLADFKEQEFIRAVKAQGEISLIADSLEKICHNLISNAVKYTDPKGKVKVGVTCQELHLVIKVSDSGCGIPESEVNRIFKRFSRVDNETEEVGTGIGLALVKELVLANRGWIDVSSKEGKGSVFTVYLPLVDTAMLLSCSVRQEARSPITIDVPELTTLPENKPIILLIEDNDDLRAYYYSLLKPTYTCLLARHGIEALNIVKTVTPSLIITDYMMPVMNGITLASRLRKRKDAAHIPIILLTARGDRETQAQSLSAHIDYCLIKPIADDELLLRIESLLALRQRWMDAIPRTADLSMSGDEPIKIPTYECDKDQAFYARFISIIEKNYKEETFNRAQAANELAVSERQLNRKLAAMMEHNFTEYLKNYRLKKSKLLLRSGEQVTQIALDVGFNSTSYFSSRFKARYGLSPTQYQEMHTEEKKRA